MKWTNGNGQGLSSLQCCRHWLVIRVLRHQLAAHREVQNEPPQPRDGIRRIGDARKMLDQALRVHLKVVPAHRAAPRRRHANQAGMTQ